MSFLAKLRRSRPVREDSSVTIVAGSPLFDRIGYARRIGGLAPEEAAAHYVATGWRDGHDPSPYFSTGWYLDTYPDVRAAGLCPLSHFLENGLAEGRSTSPFFLAPRMARSMGLREAGHPLLAYLAGWRELARPDIPLFDIDFFLAGLPADLRADIREPFAAYMAEGVLRGWDPHPLFSTRFYLERNPELEAACINPLEHFVTEGGARLRDPHPDFDSGFYVSQLTPETASGIGIPVLHYLAAGVPRTLDPSEGFSTAGYLSLNPDVRSSGLNPLVHYVRYGRAEGRPILPSRHRPAGLLPTPPVPTPPLPAVPDGSDAAVLPTPMGEAWRPLSVIIPTYNRLAVLRDTLAACERHRGGVPLEYVVVDDGSSDGTFAYLTSLSFPESAIVPLRVPHGGSAAARNAGARVASHDVLLIMGDDIRPETDDFFRAHSRFHERRPGRGETMIGKVVWPSSQVLPVTVVMAHIQGRYGQQFPFSNLIPYTRYDFRHFFTSIVSIKKALVDDWDTDGFSKDFNLYGFEDTEFAYRTSRKVADFSIYYDPLSVGSHIHPHTMASFTQRQLSAGRMAKVFTDKHPEIAHILTLDDVRRALDASVDTTAIAAADHRAIFEGLRAWITLQEAQGLLGTSGYHEDLLAAFFELAFFVGYIEADPAPDCGKANALRLAFGRFLQRMRHSISREIAEGFPCLV